MSQLISYDWQVQSIKVAGSSASVSKLDFCYLTLGLAVGNASGLVRKFFFFKLNIFSEAENNLVLALFAYCVKLV